ncbi:hypothetical protein HD806DRAFT_545447 [Xylariaceae sp. AK1471]|nr:hypothetical protein HD806DRAFT_545447 [Xylariaceae sp. AK1471]
MRRIQHPPPCPLWGCIDPHLVEPLTSLLHYQMMTCKPLAATQPLSQAALQDIEHKITETLATITQIENQLSPSDTQHAPPRPASGCMDSLLTQCLEFLLQFERKRATYKPLIEAGFFPPEHLYIIELGISLILRVLPLIETYTVKPSISLAEKATGVPLSQLCDAASALDSIRMLPTFLKREREICKALIDAGRRPQSCLEDFDIGIAVVDFLVPMMDDILAAQVIEDEAGPGEPEEGERRDQADMPRP